MQNVNNIKDCYGCGICAVICPQKIINIQLNSNGFYEPFINDLDKCTKCKLCINVCSYSHEELSLKNHKIKSYASWSNDTSIRKKASSGGFGFELGRSLIKRDYKVCGVRYNVEKNQAEHYIASTENELIQSIGSKYIQSYTLDAFKCINRKEKFLITGTPCQIDSFRRYIQRLNIEENFILMDFFCHGVPSKLMWNKYILEVEKITGKVTYVSWRNKFTGWHDSWAISIDGEKTGKRINWQDSYKTLIKERKAFFNSRLSQGDMFYNLFLSDTCLGKACYNKCKFKYDRSSADIRIGDLWGNVYKDNEDGVNAIITFTPKGDEVIKYCNITLIEHPFNIIAEGQMVKLPTYTIYCKFIQYLLKKPKISIKTVYMFITPLLLWKTLKRRILNPKQTIKNLYNKFF